MWETGEKKKEIKKERFDHTLYTLYTFKIPYTKSDITSGLNFPVLQAKTVATHISDSSPHISALESLWTL